MEPSKLFQGLVYMYLLLYLCTMHTFVHAADSHTCDIHIVQSTYSSTNIQWDNETWEFVALDPKLHYHIYICKIFYINGKVILLLRTRPYNNYICNTYNDIMRN